MLLILLRHADAVDSAGKDFERILSDKGQEQAARVGDFYSRLGLVPDRIISSNYPRAQQTAQIVAARAKVAAPVKEDSRLGCGMSIDDARDVLRECLDLSTVMMVGHQPDFSEFAGYLLGSPTGSTLAFRKACSAVFTVNSARCGGAVLQYFIPAKLLENLK